MKKNISDGVYAFRRTCSNTKRKCPPDSLYYELDNTEVGQDGHSNDKDKHLNHGLKRISEECS